MATRGELLVAILNDPADLAIAQEKHWYRIPVSSVKKWLKERWPPHWLAFYQTKVFGSEAHAINYCAEVVDIQQVFRWQLFPNQPRDDKSERCYYQLFLQPLQRLARPIPSRRYRRIVFIPTTWEKFVKAVELNDLSDESLLEDRLWRELKLRLIPAERQEVVQVKRHFYFLDFAIYCARSNLDLETDGDLWHANRERAGYDNLRDNGLETVGWRVLRFSTEQIQERMQDYCVPTIIENINRLGGIDEGRVIPRKIDLEVPDGLHQLSLFDDL